MHHPDNADDLLDDLLLGRKERWPFKTTREKFLSEEAGLELMFYRTVSLPTTQPPAMGTFTARPGQQKPGSGAGPGKPK